MGYSDTHQADSTVLFYWGIRIVISGSVLLYTNAPVDITYGGETYSSSYLFSIKQLSQTTGALQAISVEIGNADGEIGTLMQALAGKYRFPVVKVWEWWYAPTDTSLSTIQETRQLAFGRLEAPVWGESSLTFNVAPLVSSISGEVPYKGFGTLCPYASDFKGEQCGASTASFQSCGGTFAECDDRGNTARFGGMRHTPKDGQIFYYGQDGSFIVGTEGPKS